MEVTFAQVAVRAFPSRDAIALCYRRPGSKAKIGKSSGELPHVLGSKLPLFSYGRDGHQPYSRGLYTHYKDSLLDPRSGCVMMCHV